MPFEWDPEKSERNVRERGISFRVASEIFEDPNARRYDDLRFEYGELRTKIIGRTSVGDLLAVIYTIRSSGIRIISARKASRREHREYGEDHS
jgi:uncharacterized DUF497 family protein